MKGSKSFTEAIQKHLEDFAAANPAFAGRMALPEKSIDDCVKYILGEVSAIGQCGYTDEEIFGMAIHYFDEDKIEIRKSNVSHIAVNHHVDLTQEEIAEARELAMQAAIKEKKEELIQNLEVELDEQDLKIARQRAISQAVEQQRQQMMKPKKTSTSVTQKPADTGMLDLFS